MPVNETLDLRRSLQKELGLGLDQIFMNGLYPELFSDQEAAKLRDRIEAADGEGTVVLRAAIRAALSEHRRSTAQREQLQRLRAESGEDVIELPFLFRPQIDMGAVGELADIIEPGPAGGGRARRDTVEAGRR
jgi:hypothetical protein